MNTFEREKESMQYFRVRFANFLVQITQILRKKTANVGISLTQNEKKKDVAEFNANRPAQEDKTKIYDKKKG